MICLSEDSNNNNNNFQRLICVNIYFMKRERDTLNLYLPLQTRSNKIKFYDITMWNCHLLALVSHSISKHRPLTIYTSVPSLCYAHLIHNKTLKLCWVTTEAPSLLFISCFVSSLHLYLQVPSYDNSQMTSTQICSVCNLLCS